MAEEAKLTEAELMVRVVELTNDIGRTTAALAALVAQAPAHVRQYAHAAAEAKFRDEVMGLKPPPAARKSALRKGSVRAA